PVVPARAPPWPSWPPPIGAVPHRPAAAVCPPRAVPRRRPPQGFGSWMPPAPAWYLYYGLLKKLCHRVFTPCVGGGAAVWRRRGSHGGLRNYTFSLPSAHVASQMCL